MTITARIIADSQAQSGARLTTFLLTYPRWIHAEIMTHRALSRNASSSRAIPVKKIIDQVLQNPATPTHWGANQKGMQADEQVSVEVAKQAEDIWLRHRDCSVEAAEKLVDLGIHKAIANRLLEPHSHIKVVVSATEWQNFFTLRWHKMAEPHFQMLACEMKDAFLLSKPDLLKDGEWHLPFVGHEEKVEWLTEGCPKDSGIPTLVKYSVARCARTSYLTHEGKAPDHDKDIALHDMLVVQEPAHASPSEHQGFALKERYDRSGNFIGFMQYRKLIKNECASTFPWEHSAVNV